MVEASLTATKIKDVDPKILIHENRRLAETAMEEHSKQIDGLCLSVVFCSFLLSFVFSFFSSASLTCVLPSPSPSRSSLSPAYLEQTDSVGEQRHFMINLEAKKLRLLETQRKLREELSLANKVCVRFCPSFCLCFSVGRRVGFPSFCSTLPSLLFFLLFSFFILFSALLFSG
jgi:hypothetical protein